MIIGLRATFVRILLIGILLSSSFGLFTKGAKLLGWFALPTWSQFGFLFISLAVTLWLLACEYNWLGLGKKKG